MDQRKLLILTLTALVGICLFYNYNLNKRITKIIERVLSIEVSVQNITSKNKIHMNIVDAPSSSKSSKPQSLTQVRKGHSTTKTVPTQNNEKTLVGGVQSVLQTSLHDTTSHLQTLNNHLMKLHNRSIYETDDDEDDHSEQYAEDENDDDEPADDNDDEPADDNDDEPADDNDDEDADEADNETITEHYNDEYGDEEDEDEEIEYIIEYVDEEDVSEEDESENVSVNEHHNLDHYIEQAVQKNTKNKLIDVLKNHDLSTFGNKNTLVKRIMTLDNFQQYL